MASTFTNLLYHMVFSTKDRVPSIEPDFREQLYEYMGGIVRGERGVLLEIGGVPDHVHLLVKLKSDMAVAVILRLVGSLPFQVVATGGSYVQPNIADVTVTNLLFDNGVRAHVFVSWLHPFKEQRLVVVGSRKMASFDDVSKKLVVYDERVDWTTAGPTPVSHPGTEIPFSPEEPLRSECQAFLAAVSSRGRPLTDGRSAVSVLRVLQAAQRSLMTNGQAVEVPMEAIA